jgi:phosphoribosyl-ATP pyrophosphohydrolase
MQGLSDWAIRVASLLAQFDGDTREMRGLAVSKVAEEAGEAIQAWGGFVGQNPRKGITNDVDKVIAELADTLVTAAVAIARLGGHPAMVVQEHIATMKDSGRMTAYERAAWVAKVTREGQDVG